MSSPLRSISFMRSSTGSIFSAFAGRFSRTFLAALRFMTIDYNILSGFEQIRLVTALRHCARCEGYPTFSPMHKPRFFDCLAMANDLGDDWAFNSFANGIRRPFQPDYVEPKWPRDRVVDIKHIKLQVALDFKARRIAGTATHPLAAILDGLKQLEFDAAEMEVSAVRVGAEPHSFDYS